MTQVANNFEGGSDGVTMTSGSGGNTGGASGDFFDNVTGSPTFSATQKRGTMAADIFTTASATKYFGWNPSLGTLTDAYGRVYVYLDIGASTNLATAPRFLEYRDSTGLAAFIRPAATGRVTEIANAAGSIVKTGSTAWAKNQWIRIEYRITFSTTAGYVEVRVYNTADSVTADETVTTTTSEVLKASATVVRIGCTTSQTNFPVSGGHCYLDDIVAGATSWPGPAVAAGSLVTRPKPQMMALLGR